jgi:hypothetical protein
MPNISLVRSKHAYASVFWNYLTGIDANKLNRVYRILVLYVTICSLKTIIHTVIIITWIT